MKKQVLAKWVEDEIEARGSLASLARALCLTHSAVQKWRNKKCDSLSPSSVAAISGCRGESVGETREWLGLPAVNSDRERQIAHFKNQILKLEAA